MDNPSWNQIRPGDLIRYDNSASGHVVVVTSKTDEYIKVTESGLNNHARWGGQYFKWWLEEQPGYALYTRYPEQALAGTNGRRPAFAGRRPNCFPVFALV